eukprot:Blabericola_migrator_1__13449@NODE_968_length_5872_cov_146_680276_g670_i0_p1_GENE_NODE_968_length_5872_cov_146_680276_g670_i0NODE_968_length_5872_cov_146_680276_g670_i0_p1_ORF_typecomplete_len1115_score254_25TPR_16/PF13432_6/0_16TPR_16/PF13432_6/6_6e05TPR_MalT/PF17874_1/2e07TPR_MalT/PF17874_1/1_2e03DUF3856/PF12968_7/1_9e06DUF3856/PF12968_7/6_4e02ANAPC3/PF12895_7/0_00089ANAPC3/PF12895_7/0_0014TPR_2/PF07719_17/0_036TPR_2/PF07719_17/38TPR_2/PF07719_17/0_25TPR_12/PF13424_6/0_00043TPR_12/PF13424_6/2_
MTAMGLPDLNDVMKDMIGGDETRLRALMKEMPPELLKAMYSRCRELGKTHFASGDYKEAFEQYSAALCLTTDMTDRALLFANRSACFLRQGRYRDALSEAHKSIASCRTYAKGWFRAGESLEALKDYKGARSVFAQCAKLAGVDLNDSIRNKDDSVYKRWAAVDEKLFLERRSQRYHIDYSRFEAVCRELTHQEETILKAEPAIEFSSDLTPEQRAALEAQLTGRVDLSSITPPMAGPPVGLALPMDRESRLKEVTDSDMQSEAAGILRIFRTQYEARFGDRFFGLLDSGLCESFSASLIEVLKEKPIRSQEGVVFIGYGSLIPVMRAVKFLLTTCIDVPPVHLIARGSAYTATDTFMRFCQANKIRVIDIAHFHRDMEVLELGPAPSDGPSGTSTPMTDESEGVETVSQETDPETALSTQGGHIMSQVQASAVVPRSVALKVIDMEALDGYLMGPRFPSLLSLMSVFHESPCFPSRIVLKARLLKLEKLCFWSQDPLMDKYLKWSLHPVPVDAALLKSATLSSPITITTFPSDDPSHYKSNIILNVTESDWSNMINNGPDALLFSLEIYQSDKKILDTLHSPRGSLSPFMLWLHKGSPGLEPGTVRVCVRDAIIIGVEIGDTHTSFVDTVSVSCDRHASVNWFSPHTSPLKQVVECVTHTRDTVSSRMKLVSNFVDPDINILCLGVGDLGHALAAIEACLSRRVGLEAVLHKDPETSLILMDESAGNVRLLRALLTTHDTLTHVRHTCWTELPKALQKDEWVGGKKEAEETTKSELVENWLFHQTTKSGLPRLQIKSGSVQVLRCLDETPETRAAVAALFSVPPDTPGIESKVGCIEVPPLDIIVMGTEFPSDPISSGFIRDVLYVKEALARRSTSRVWPGNIRMEVQLVRHSTTSLQPLNCDAITALRCPVIANDGDAFLKRRSLIDCAVMEASHQLEFMTEPLEILNLDFAQSPGSLKRSLMTQAQQRFFKIRRRPTSSGLCNGVVIQAMYEGNGTLPRCLLQNLPPSEIENVVGLTMTFLTSTEWELRLNLQRGSGLLSPTERERLSSPIAHTLEQKQAELAHHLSQSLVTSKEVVKQVSTACIKYGALPCNEHFYDSEIPNNLLFAALS